MDQDSPDDDWRDIQAVRDGDRDAYARLVARHQAPVAALLWRFTRDREQWETLVQNVLVEAYYALPGFQGRGTFQGWLRKIATRVGYRYWKQRAAARRRGERTLDEFSSLMLSDDVPDDPSEAADLAHRLLARLAPRDRLVVTLRYLEECSVSEIAARTGWSQAMVKVQAHRARKKLRRLLATLTGAANEVERGPTRTV